jgi:hypothetical protein
MEASICPLSKERFLKTFLIISELWINWIENELKWTMNELQVLVGATHEYIATYELLHMNKNLQLLCKIKCNTWIYYACTPNDKDVIKIFMIQMLIRRLGVWTCCQILDLYGIFFEWVHENSNGSILWQLFDFYSIHFVSIFPNKTYNLQFFNRNFVYENIYLIFFTKVHSLQ